MADKEDYFKPSGSIQNKSTYTLGIDIARRGVDQTAFVILEKPFTSDKYFVIFIQAVNFPNLTQTIGRVLNLHASFNFKKIYVDNTGLGAGVGDVLKEKLGGGIIEEVTFTRKSKPEMFYNLKLLMQQGKLKIPDYIQGNIDIAKKLYFQFLSIQQEFTGDSDIPRIYHRDNEHDDIICALALAALYFSPKHKSRGYFLAGVQ